MKTARLLGLVLALVVGGCSAGTYGSTVTPDQKAAIVKGKTSKVEILRELGNPDQSLDLGGGKEQLSYIREKVTSHGINASSENTEFWVVVSGGVVEDFGERPTTKSPNYFK